MSPSVLKTASAFYLTFTKVTVKVCFLISRLRGKHNTVASNMLPANDGLIRPTVDEVVLPESQ